MTRKDLTVERKENGKTYMDNTNATELENTYVQMASLDLYNDLSKKYTGMELQELIDDIGITEESDSETFGIEFTKALQGDTKTPSNVK
jgi:hypothetical protein